MTFMGRIKKITVKKYYHVTILKNKKKAFRKISLTVSKELKKKKVPKESNKFWPLWLERRPK